MLLANKNSINTMLVILHFYCSCGSGWYSISGFRLVACSEIHILFQHSTKYYFPIPSVRHAVPYLDEALYTSRKVAGSIPYEALDLFSLPNPSNRNMALGSTQPLTEMSTRNLPGGKQRPALKTNTSPPPVSRLSRKYGSLDV
jgi:hypothetical protein